jgi:hypothetical protein
VLGRVSATYRSIRNKHSNKRPGHTLQNPSIKIKRKDSKLNCPQLRVLLANMYLYAWLYVLRTLCMQRCTWKYTQRRCTLLATLHSDARSSLVRGRGSESGGGIRSLDGASPSLGMTVLLPVRSISTPYYSCLLENKRIFWTTSFNV